MKRLLRHRARRLPALIATLALFLMGSNYCVLSALSGNTPMACLTVAGDASSAAVPACHRAASSATPSQGRHHEKPAAKPSCCPDPVVAPAAPEIEKADDASTALPYAVLAAIIAPTTPSAIDRHGPRPAPDAEPPPCFAHAPVPARAPPLA